MSAGRLSSETILAIASATLTMTPVANRALEFVNSVCAGRIGDDDYSNN